MNTIEMHRDVSELVQNLGALGEVFSERISAEDFEEIPAAALYYQVNDAARFIDRQIERYGAEIRDIDRGLLAAIRDGFFALAATLAPYLEED